MKTTLTLVEKALDGHRGLNLPASCTRGQCSCVQSPYLGIRPQRVGKAGRDIKLPLDLMLKAFPIAYFPNSTTVGVTALLEDSTGVNTFCFSAPFVNTVSISDTDATIAGYVVNAINAYCDSQSIPHPDSIDWLFATPSSVALQIAAAIPAAPSSYQTIVTQTGTGAPAVTGSLVPASTYAAGTTFTWARTSAGVYTLTASTAVFNTSGKTAVFVGPLNNLNASCTAVVTSSTVVTITTGVQSVAVLGLLGLTATPTDALLTKAMVYVQTYP